MMLLLLARKAASLHNQRSLLRTFNFCIKFLATIPNKDDGAAPLPPSECSTTTRHLSPFLSDFDHPTSGYNIELVDGDAWGVSSGVAQAWPGRHWATSAAGSSDGHQLIDEAVDSRPSHVEGDNVDFEDVDNMRVRGNLFYKLERSSKEFEEYNLEFHRKKSSKKKDSKKEDPKEAKKAKTSPDATSKNKLPKVHEVTRSKIVIMPPQDEINEISTGNKRQRNPTFNQLTGPYHEPFCLDIYISKASVRACIVHRVSSKVVAVAHSISKDLKFDLASTKNKSTCAAVGAILAQRALADDIHDVIYTPRKGERLEGKLQIVLQSIIDNGINVKVKIKHRPKRSFLPHWSI